MDISCNSAPWLLALQSSEIVYVVVWRARHISRFDFLPHNLRIGSGQPWRRHE